MKRFGIVAVALLASLGMAQENYSTWTYSKSITVNTKASGANLAAPVTKFPVLVRLTHENGGDVVYYSKGRGADIRFTKADGVTRLHHQIDAWDSAAHTAALWVLLDTVKANDSTQSIKLFWNKTAVADSSNGSKVFDTANGYASVWHLGTTNAGADTATRPNSIAGRFGAKATNFAPGYRSPYGVIGLADTLTGGSSSGPTSYLAINEGTPSTYYNFGAGQFTFSGWFNATTVDNFARLMSLVSDDGTSGTNRLFLSFNGGNIIGRQYADGGSRATNSTTPMPTGTWNHLAMTITRGTSDTTRLYLDGALIQQTLITQLFPDAARDYVRIGRDNINPTSDQSYNGKVDEARLSHVARTADVIKLSYDIEKPTSSVVILGASTPTPPAIPPAVVSVAAFASSQPSQLSAKSVAGGMAFRLPAGLEGSRVRLSITDMRGVTVWDRTVESATAGSEIVWQSRTAGAYVARLVVLDGAGKSAGSYRKTFALAP
jgi:hypothetical protein